jgi:nucleotide-binding universal stress UspA family protein
VKEYSNIFVALDGTEAQRAVLSRAASIAADNHAKLTMGHVVDSLPADANGGNPAALAREVRERLEDDLAAELADIRANSDIADAELRVAAGPVIETLTQELIANCKPDLVVCGERGLSNVKYAFVGSVSTHLIRTMSCDVLVVKQR